MNDTFPYDTSGCIASANSVRGRFGTTMGPSGSHSIIRQFQKASGPRRRRNRDVSFLGHAPKKGVVNYRAQYDNATDGQALKVPQKRNAYLYIAQSTVI